MIFLRTCLLLCLLFSLQSFAGPNASGGVPETEFQHDRDALQTILDFGTNLEILKNKGALISITPDSVERDVYILKTDKCTLPVRFIRECNFENGLASCKRSAEVLTNRASGDCNP